MRDDFTLVKSLMDCYHEDWHPHEGSRIWIVRDLKQDSIVACAVIRPWDHDFVIDQYESRYGWAGKVAGHLMEGFFRDFKKESGKRLFAVIMNHRTDSENVMLRRGCKHVGSILEV